MAAAVFSQFKTNPESFLLECIRLINEQKATCIIEHLTYDPVDDCFDLEIFARDQTRQDFSDNVIKTNKNIQDFMISGSKIERDFVKEIDASHDVVVYAKLPRGFLIPTPIGEYNPDWAIVFREGSVKHVYFVAETKGSMSTMKLRPTERMKIECAYKFFEKIHDGNVKYDVVDSFSRLMEIIK